ncbi:cap-specific mRNA (nucleoside-2'-O-)-methyltransferase 2-like [Scleropages formosus]|nr:cap-specific mRNA (nucleoside-2'-O-)-methyltransferase 2 [Scleropages formosus]KPP65632.1 cap-specific mRNA (nucleoside-2'-O-)-methyltransferase 2-like [Scleropages formosus]
MMSRMQGMKQHIKTEKAPNSCFSLDVVSEIQELFSKITTYFKPHSEEWQLPDPKECLVHASYQHTRLQALKNSLNDVKNRLSDKNLEVWHQHTSFTNRAGKITAHVRAAANAEVCTQAWCKFYEILGTFSVIPNQAMQRGELRSVHLCEAPGAFIASLNHYLKSKSLYCDWTWVANTLNPYYEGNQSGTMIIDDRLIANTLPWWFFGSDNTGDIMLQKHLLELQSFTRNMRTVDLVTADGSFDCQGNPDEQEALVAPLHYCEAVAALLLLSQGGSFVLKMFTLYEHSSVCLLYLLNCSFRSVHVFKPATSKAGNSEVYVVCLEYCSKETLRPLLSKMIRNFGPDILSRGVLFPNSLIPVTFLRQHEEICSYFYKHQVQTITENLQLFQSMTAEQQQKLNNLRDCAVEFYMDRFQVRHLHRSKWLSKNTVQGSIANSKLLGYRKQVGSFNERKKLESLAWKEKVLKGFYKAQVEEHTLQAMGSDCVLVGPAVDCDIDSWYVLVGATMGKVRSSPFCDLELLNNLNEALEQSSLIKDHAEPAKGHLVPLCSVCRILSPQSILSDVFSHSYTLSDHATYDKSQCCVVVGSSSFLSHLPEKGKTLRKVSQELLRPSLDRLTLHDGDPQYQHELLSCILQSFHSLQTGASLVLPILSAFTRFTAGLVLALHQCFRSITFRCPAAADSLGSVAVLLCMDYQQPPNSLLTFLEDVRCQMSSIPPTGSACQVLQFVPVEVLFKGALPEFLWNVNTAIAKHRLHVLIAAEQSLIMQAGQII